MGSARFSMIGAIGAGVFSAGAWLAEGTCVAATSAVEDGGRDVSTCRFNSNSSRRRSSVTLTLRSVSLSKLMSKFVLTPEEKDRGERCGKGEQREHYEHELH